MSKKTIKRIECLLNALITTFIANWVWGLIERIMTGSVTSNNVDSVMLSLFFLYVYWWNMREATNEMEKKNTP